VKFIYIIQIVFFFIILDYSSNFINFEKIFFYNYVLKDFRLTEGGEFNLTPIHILKRNKSIPLFNFLDFWIFDISIIYIENNLNKRKNF
jgi:hypothetical protein